jgi:hypothetical protein
MQNIYIGDITTHPQDDGTWHVSLYCYSIIIMQ